MDFSYNTFGRTEEQIIKAFKGLEHCQPKSAGKIEAWEIEPTRYGMRFVVITRFSKLAPGRNPKLTFIRKIDVEK